MAVTHASLGIAGLVLLAGSVVMLFFVVLSAVDVATPLSATYFLRADTSGITGARPVSQWTYFYVCGDGNTDCGPAEPALPLGHAWAADPPVAPPAALLGSYGGGTTSYYFWYMWRFGWVFYLLGLFFDVLAFFSGFVACFGRLGSAVAALTSAIALFFLSIAVSMMTAVFVKMRDAFLADGRDATLGRYAFGFSWGAWAALLLATALFGVGIRRAGASAAGAGAADGVTSRGRWRRTRSTRSRKSYDMGSRRVKEEYP
ncbi:hypothetical protein P8C59_009466 [Phyllachora maydis]|uniref:Cortical patch protein n=1 Tax=Phyllachora maydis TaxID=1825666 RepID=A0AAD9MJS7_9PEZI|nr:hypothetical protein P8C59_009466 [Phyllachora maydis]